MSKLDELIIELKKDLKDSQELSEHHQKRFNYYETESLDIKNTIAELEYINGTRNIS